jgi:hypothetical protein
MKFPKLYKKNSSGKVQEWEIYIEGQNSSECGSSDIIVKFGIRDGKFQEKRKTISKGKNTGRSNATTHYEQAISEAESTWKKQLDKGYIEDESKIDDIVILPMLAKKLDDHIKKVKWPAIIQRKYDGCLHYDSLVEFDDGRIEKIGDVVNQKMRGKVKCYNITTEEVEFKEIDNWMVNLSDKDTRYENNNNWYEIELETGETIRLTGNHRVWVESLKCYRRVDTLKGNEFLLLQK